MGNYDLPVTIDYILNITNQQNLYFLGHSIGSSAGFISCSLRPEYNKKIRLFLALGPLANVRHTLNPLHKIIFSMGSALVVSSPTHTRTLHRNVTFKQFIESMDIHEVLPRREYASKLVKMACEDGSPLQKLCLMTIFSIVGDDFGELDTVRTNTPRDHLHPVLFQTTFPRFVRFYPAGTSLKVVANVIQYYLSGGADTPPESKVQNSFQASSRGATSAPPRPTGCTTTAARRPFSTCPKSPLPSRCTTDRAICW